MTPRPRRSRMFFEPRALWPDAEGGDCICTQVYGCDKHPRLILGREGRPMVLTQEMVRVMLPYLNDYANRGNLLPWPMDRVDDWII